MKNRNIPNNIHWRTPVHVKRWIIEKFGYYFDPCPFYANFDGLKVKWKEFNYVNPGFDLKTKTAFVKKAIAEMIVNNSISLVNIPFTCETDLFHKYIYRYASRVYIPNKRIKYAGFNSKGIYTKDNSGQQGTVFVLFDGLKTDTRQMPEFEIIKF